MFLSSGSAWEGLPAFWQFVSGSREDWERSGERTFHFELGGGRQEFSETNDVRVFLGARGGTKRHQFALGKGQIPRVEVIPDHRGEI